MRVPVSWLRDLVDVPASATPDDLADLMVSRGLEIEEVHRAEVTGPVVVGRVLSAEPETHTNGRTVRWCQVDVGEAQPRGIVCGAPNAEAGGVVVVSLPGAVLPGGFAIAARRTYGHVSDGMICSVRELGLGEEHDGILRLDLVGGPAASAAPGTPAVPLLGLGDTVLEFAVTPDRGYALSMRGVARELAGALGVPFTDPAPEAAPWAETAGPDAPFRLEDARCPRVTAVELSGFDAAAASPAWLSDRLVAAGFRPVSLVVDVTNYVLVELGQPTHAYDADRLTGQVMVREARPGERLRTLDGTDRALDGADLVIADQSGPVGLAGVMGGAATEITSSTARLLLESADFDPVTIARTARRHRLGSEASRRFERGVDPTLSARGARRVAELLVELGGARASGRGGLDGVRVGADPALSAPPALELDLTLPARVLGTDVSQDRAAAALEQVGCTLSARAGSVTVTPPPWRPDVTDPYDLVEEVGRVVGLENIAPRRPRAPLGGGLTLSHRRRRRVVEALVGAGFVESPSYPFVSAGSLDALGIPAGDPRRRLVRLSNPIAGTEPYLRTTLLPGLIGALRRNLGRGSDDGAGGLALFDLGPVVLGPPDGGALHAPRPPVDRRPGPEELEALVASLPAQPRHVAVVVSGSIDPAGWWGPGRPAGWSVAVEAVRLAGAAVGVEVTAAAAELAPWHPGRCAVLSVAGGPADAGRSGDGGSDDAVVVLGHAGELHPRVCAELDLPARTVAAEFDLDALFAAAPDRADATSPSTFPVAKADLAFVVDAGVPAAALTAAVRAGAGGVLESVRVFDVYTGPQVGAGQRSMACALRLRAPDRTLTEAEIAAAVAAAVREAGARVGAVLRA